MINLNKGELSVEGVTGVELRELHSKFRQDILDMQIPHYRPIGFRVGNQTWEHVDLKKDVIMSSESNVSRIKILGRSYAEMSFVLDKLICCEKGTHVADEIQSGMYSIINADCSFVNLNGKNIGPRFPESMQYDKMGSTKKVRNLLVKESILTTLAYDVFLSVILLKGIGCRDFNVNSYALRGTKYKPVRTLYNLYDYMTLDIEIVQNRMKLHYNREVDEDVLKDILEEYFSNLLGGSKGDKSKTVS